MNRCLIALGSGHAELRRRAAFTASISVWIIYHTSQYFRTVVKYFFSNPHSFYLSFGLPILSALKIADGKASFYAFCARLRDSASSDTFLAAALSTVPEDSRWISRVSFSMSPICHVCLLDVPCFIAWAFASFAFALGSPSALKRNDDGGGSQGIKERKYGR
ncbi:hypothetical protein BC832DRAFT_566202 [Gaertneriomyces semiglobifer]|nr:hypothetical protein BC832DRAFT_566202 [Gaertneriomyces semiglobifer]